VNSFDGCKLNKNINTQKKSGLINDALTMD